jgi:hypothetical protein
VEKVQTGEAMAFTRKAVIRFEVLRRGVEVQVAVTAEGDSSHLITLNGPHRPDTGESVTLMQEEENAARALMRARVFPEF